MVYDSELPQYGLEHGNVMSFEELAALVAAGDADEQNDKAHLLRIIIAYGRPPVICEAGDTIEVSSVEVGSPLVAESYLPDADTPGWQEAIPGSPSYAAHVSSVDGRHVFAEGKSLIPDLQSESMKVYSRSGIFRVHYLPSCELTFVPNPHATD